MDATDIQLQRRWISDRDADAFSEIVARHAGMVYNTCRRVLGNAAEAEDITQDCFLRLAQEPQAFNSLPGWLHRMATHRSLDRRRKDQRRRQREIRFSESRTQSIEVHWDDIQHLIDEAIAALPDKYRAPLVSHFFEGQSYAAIAKRMGIPAPTAASRVRRGVERIRRSLKRQGAFITSAALSSALAQAKAEALSAPLRASLSRIAISGTGGPAAPAVAGALVTKKVLVSIPLIAALACIGVFLVQQTPERPGNVAAPTVPQATTKPEESPAQANETAPPFGEALLAMVGDSNTVASDERSQAGQVSGRVVDEAGSPVAARVRARSAPTSFESVSTGDEGRFTITGLKPSPNLYLQAFHNDSGPDYDPSKETSLISSPTGPFYLTDAGRSEIEIVVHPAGSIEGRLVDGAGRPVSGMLVSGSGVSADLLHVQGARSGPDGRFKLSPCAADTYRILAYPPGTESISLDSALDEVALEPGQHVKGLTLLYAPYVHVAGRVVDEYGKPVKDAEVMGTYQATVVKTDERGEFDLQLFSGEPLGFGVRHPDYASRGFEPTGDLEHLEVVLQPRGSVTGRVIDATTRKPVQEYEIMHLGARVNSLEFRRFFNRFTRVQNTMGRFTLRPSNSVYEYLTIGVRANGYALKVQGFEEVQVGSDMVLALEPGNALAGTVRDAEGNGVPGAKIYLETLPYGYELEEDEEVLVTKSDDSGRFELDNAPAGEFLVFAWHSDHPPTWKRISVPRQESLDLVLPEGTTLRGTITIDGKPAAAGVINLHYGSPRLAGFSALARHDGTFVLKNPVPGEVTVSAAARATLNGTRLEWNKPATVRAGETTVVDFDFPTACGSMIEGRITMEGRAPERGSVRIRLSEGVFVDTRLDTNGFYRVEYLTPGEVSLHVAAGFEGEYIQTTETLGVEPETHITHDMALWPGIDVQARVTGARAEEAVSFVLFPGRLDIVASVDNLLSRTHYPALQFGIQNSGNGYSVSNVQPGTYTAVARAAPRNAGSSAEAAAAARTAMAHIEVADEEDIALELTLP